MRAFKWLIGGLTIILVLIALIFAYLAISFDPNDHKQRVIDIVKEKTGRDVQIDGDIEMSFYPWLGITMGTTTVSNAQGFQAKNFAEFNQASARLELMPLLQKQIVADRIELSGAEVWLERNLDGVTNWDDMVEKLTGVNPVKTDADNAQVSPFTGAIAGLEISDMVVHWNDAVSGDAINISQLNFETGNLIPGEEVTIDTDFHFELQKPVIQGQAKLIARTPLSFTAPYIFKKPNLELNLQGIDLQAQNIQANIVGDELTFANGKLSFILPNITYDISNMPSLGEQIKGVIGSDQLDVDAGNIQFNNFLLDAEIEGSALPGDSAKFIVGSQTLQLIDKKLKLNTAEVNAEMMGEPWPQGQQTFFTTFEKFTFDTANSSLLIPEFTAQALDLDLKGSVTAEEVTSNIFLNGQLNIADFSLKELAKKLDIDLPEMSDEAWQSASLQGQYRATNNSISFSQLTAMIDQVGWTGSAAIDNLDEKKLSFDLKAKSLDLNRLLPPEQAEALKDNENERSEEEVDNISIPIEPLRLWDVNGQVSLGKFTFGNMISTDVTANIDLVDGLLQLSPTAMKVFGGQEQGGWTLDVRPEIPTLVGQEQFTAIDLAKVGAAMWQQEYMTGLLSGSMSVETQGKTLGAMRSNLNGELDVKIDDGILQGVDVNYALANAVSLFREKTFSGEKDTKQTPFEELSATGEIVNGVLQNDDFLAILPRMRVRGKGSFNFIDTRINYFIDADVLESKSSTLDESVEVSLDELVGATIPIKITGELSEPKIRPDVAGYLRAKFEQDLKDQARDKIKDKLKDKVGEELGGVLGGLLGGGQEEPESQPELTPEDFKAIEDNQAQDSGNNNSDEEQNANPDPSPEKPKDEEPKEEKPLTPEEELKQKEDELKKKAKDKLKDLLGG